MSETPAHLPDQALHAIPEPLREDVARYWERFSEAAERDDVGIPQAPEQLRELASVWAVSDFVATACIRQPGLLGELLAGDGLERPYGEGEYADRLTAALEGTTDEKDLGTRLRRFRRREMVRIAWRELTDRAPVDEVLAELTGLADACIDGALAWLEGWLRDEWGIPRDADGNPQSLVVLGMGKLGAGELNFSSDIDLLFAYPEPGETGHGRSTDEFFTRLGQRLIGVLSEQTAEGFVFRVDMRLRPYGDSGPLVASFDALETYYQAQGRDWERYAMIKARPVAGDRGAGAQLMDLLRPFVYRRYLDFGAYASLREMKALVQREVSRKGLEHNIKLGAGGIREIEFIGQAFQLIRGGREPALRQRGIVTVLAYLGEQGYLPAYVAQGLIEVYRFLRRLENRLQMRADQQTHALPEQSVERIRIAYAMGYADWDRLAAEVTRYREVVHSHFEQVVSAPQTGEADTGPDLAAVWRGTLEDEEARATLSAAGFDDPAEALRIIEQLREGHSYRGLGARGRERMDQLMPLLLAAVAGTEGPEQTLLRMSNLLDTVARRAAYLSLLVENPMALSQLVRLCAASSWIADFVRRHPLTLDELLDPRTLYKPLDRAGLEQALEQALAGVEPGDLEAEMDALRRFKQVNTLRVAAADIVGAMPLMVVSDHLTELAEVLVGQVCRIARAHLEARHGRPQCAAGEPARFAVLGYGKLGGFELGYGSDLDLVFLYECPGGEGSTDGDKSLDNAEFFARLGQRIIHILSARTSAGVLYEVDPRLRPSGAAGLLVSTLEAFRDYQRDQAWTWEHQALVRARPVAGDQALADAFRSLRHDVLAQSREAAALRREVRDMRQRMLNEHGSRKRDVFDLKHDRGGMTDIEFIAQYGVLAWAHAYPALTRYPDNIRIFEGLAREGLMASSDAEQLCDAYRAYRARGHRLTLQGQPARVAAGEFSAERELVQRVWSELLED